jgi:hypothetical protein
VRKKKTPAPIGVRVPRPKFGSPVPQAGWGLLIRGTGDSVFSLLFLSDLQLGRDQGVDAPPERYFCGEVAARLDLVAIGRQAGAMNVQNTTPFPKNSSFVEHVTFDRSELSAVLGIYGRMVAAGEWRDYGMSFHKDVAIFSIFRRTSEHPIYRVEKRPKFRLRQAMYSVICMDGRILKRGNDLKAVLRVLERKLIRAVD